MHLTRCSEMRTGWCQRFWTCFTYFMWYMPCRSSNPNIWSISNSGIFLFIRNVWELTFKQDMPIIRQVNTSVLKNAISYWYSLHRILNSQFIIPWFCHTFMLWIILGSIFHLILLLYFLYFLLKWLSHIEYNRPSNVQLISIMVI